MSQINNKQGAIKLNEVTVNEASPLINTQIREDAETFFDRNITVIQESFYRHFFLASSNLNCKWLSPNFTVKQGTNLDFHLLSNSGLGISRTVTCRFSAVSYDVIWDLSAHNNSFIYLELSRDEIKNSTGVITLTDGINTSGTPGRRLRIGNPILKNYFDGSNPDGTLLIPVILRRNNSIWWVHSGHHWNNNTISPVGTNIEPSETPIGSIIGLHRQFDTDISTPAKTQSWITANMPGWWLCDGSIISYPGSPMNGIASPNLNGSVGDGNGRYIRGNCNSNGTGGQLFVYLSSNQLPAHVHQVTSNNIQPHEHFTNFYLRPCGGGESNVWMEGNSGGTSYLRTPYQSHYHNSGNAGSGIPIDNNPAYTTVVYIIKVI